MFEDRNYGPLVVLDPKELSEVLALPENKKRNHLISGYVDYELKQIMCFRGSGTSLAIPFDIFKPSGTGLEPDFEKLEFIDYGLTLKLGEYEAAVDAILYEIDEDYRNEINSDINTWEGKKNALGDRKKVFN